ncbi:hypothetical protein DPMN_159994 [Dreissena polymorpha]|uniref:Uncharacterized protein n=1 Tax=Dreissena polymorpha TaxID=45954 RepID=A0A9D4EMN2_DREPO|nr:hypothetical protein DPMN_159994 [Dreissena polymorpha]
MLLSQDFYDEIFKQSSAADRKAICQLKFFFNFLQVRSYISECFLHAWEFMATIVEGFVCLLLMEYLNMNSPSDRPQTAPDGIEAANNLDKQEYFYTITATVVNEIWQTHDVSKLTCEDFTDEHVICCGKESVEDMIGCECRSQ